jgi:hypothetical protein
MKLLSSLKAFIVPGALLSALFLALPMWATLGDNAASVLSDQAHMQGSTLHSTDNKTYVVHEISTSWGGKIREYVSPGGAVFGVVWEGQFSPNLQQLMGPYYQQARQARQAQAEQATESAQTASGSVVHTRRAPVVIQTPGLVVHETGHTRSFHGLAYIPQLIPQGVQPSDIR